MFKCNDCGAEFCDNTDCINCGSYNIEEGEKCYRCGEFVEGVSGKGVYCDSCLKEEATVSHAEIIGSVNKGSIEINGYLAYAFSSSEIEQLLIKRLHEIPNFMELQAEKYCFEDKSDFMDWVPSWEEKC